MRYYSLKVYSLGDEFEYPYIQILTEYLASNMRMSDREVKMIYYKYGKPINILGYYNSYDGYSRYRRITGGPPFKGRFLTYISLIHPYYRGLRDLYKDISWLFSDLGIGLGSAGYINYDGDIHGVYGLTKLGGVAITEILIDIDIDIDFRDLEGKFIGLDVNEEYDLSRFDRLIWRYINRNWIGYSYEEGDVEEFLGDREGYYMKISLDIYEDLYIRKAYIEGNFNASPPSGPYTLVASIKGGQINELLFHQLKIGFKNIDVHGIDDDTINSGIDRLFEKALEVVK